MGQAPPPFCLSVKNGRRRFASLLGGSNRGSDRGSGSLLLGRSLRLRFLQWQMLAKVKDASGGIRW